MTDYKMAPVVSFFFPSLIFGCLTRTLFQWLSFQYFVRNEQLLSFDESNPPEDVSAWLALWREQRMSVIERPDLGWVFLGAAIMGVFAMSGMLAVRMGQPVNLWLPLFLFAALPLIMSLITATRLFNQQHGRANDQGGLVFRLLRLQRQRHWLSESPRLIMPWLYWQLQRVASVFMLGALLTFFLVATFQELKFVWSSTFIHDSSTMKALLDVIASPWSWLVSTPDLGDIEMARFGAELSNTAQLWPFLIAAMLFYGLLPRLVLATLFRRQLKNRLLNSIQCSGTVDKFLNVQRQQVSRQALMADDAEVEVAQYKHPVSGSFLGWRLADTVSYPDGYVRNLGLGDWREEEAWLASDQAILPQPLQLLVSFWQTPTGDLEDCLQQIRDKNGEVGLVLFECPDSDTGEREQAQLASWRYFAERAAIPLHMSSNTALKASTSLGDASESL